MKTDPQPERGESSAFCPGCGWLIGIAIRPPEGYVALDRDQMTGALLDQRHICAGAS